MSEGASPGSAGRLKIPSDIVGAEAGPVEQAVEARWLMAYAAGLGETDPCYYDTAAPGGPLAHPLFPVCYEWPVSQPVRHLPALAPFFPLLVHAEHDLRIHRPPRAGDRLSTRVRILSVAQRKPGAFVVFRFETLDAEGEAVSSSDFGALYRGVGVEGADRGPAEPLKQAEGVLGPDGTIEIPATLAHVYTECARIWNPIHTDVAHARAAGLPGIILHGTATLALSISRVLRAHGVEPGAVRRVRCRFSGMVTMPSRLQVFSYRLENQIWFETRQADGEAVIRGASLHLDA